MVPWERVLDLESESLGSSLALPFTTVILGVTHLRSQNSLFVSSSVKSGQQFLALANGDGDYDEDG